MTVDPNTSIQQAIDQWKQQQAQQTQDQTYLVQMIQQMVALCQQGGNGTQEAFEIGEMCVMPGAMTVQGDSMGGLGSAMNISSAAQTFITDMQNDINNGQYITSGQAVDFTTLLKEIYDRVEGQVNNTDPSQQWMDKTTAQNLAGSLTKLAQEFDVKATPDNLDPDAVQLEVSVWVQFPTGISNTRNSTTSETGQQHIQNIQSDMTQSNNSVSAQNQSLTAQEQFASNTYNQYMNACTDIFQSTQQFEQNMVQHEIAS